MSGKRSAASWWPSRPAPRSESQTWQSSSTRLGRDQPGPLPDPDRPVGRQRPQVRGELHRRHPRPSSPSSNVAGGRTSRATSTANGSGGSVGAGPSPGSPRPSPAARREAGGGRVEPQLDLVEDRHGDVRALVRRRHAVLLGRQVRHRHRGPVRRAEGDSRPQVTSASTHRFPPANSVARAWLAERPYRSTSTATSAGPASGAARKCALRRPGPAGRRPPRSRPGPRPPGPGSRAGSRRSACRRWPSPDRGPRRTARSRAARPRSPSPAPHPAR